MPFRLGYRPELDGMRAIAILAVLFFHAPIPGWNGRFLPGGWVGVDIFFVLSGFLITTLLLDEHRRTTSLSLKRFYMRRVLRLAPALLVMLIVWCGYAWRVLPEADARQTCWQSLATLFYVSNWMMALNVMGMYELVHTWSLSVEEQFYLVWPLVCYGLLRAGIRTRGLVVVLISGAALSVIVRCSMLVSGNVGLERLYYGSDTRADTLLIGCIVGVLAFRGTLERISHRRRILAAAASGAMLFLGWVSFNVTQGSRILYAWTFTVIAMATALVLVWVLYQRDGVSSRILAAAPLVWIGRRSYGIYLWHLPVAAAVSSPVTALIGGAEPHWTLPLFVFLSSTVVVAALSFRYVEEPILALKGRYSSRGGLQVVREPIPIAEPLARDA